LAWSITCRLYNLIMFDKLLMAAAQPVAATDSDQYIANTELLLKGEGSNGQTNSTFVDSSASNHSITPYDDVTQGSFSPFSPKGWSGYFQGAASIGNSDCLTTPSITDFSFGTGDFTIEAWVYWENYNDWKYIVDTRNSSYTSGRWLFIGGYQTGLIRFYDSTLDLDTSSNVQVPLHQWTHVAVSRTSGTLKMYINGVAGYTNTNHTASTNAPPSGGGDITIGSRYQKEKPFYGYLSNLRIVKGTGLYPNDFTPPSEPLTAVTNTKLLTLQDNRFVDNSPNNLTLTTHNEPAIKPTSPFSGDRTYPKASYFSGKFDGSNDRLDLSDSTDFRFGSGDFTIECWVYLTDYPYFNNTGNQYASYESALVVKDESYREFIFKLGGTQSSWTYVTFTGFSSNSQFDYLTSSYNFSLHTWYHIACVRNGSSVKHYVNGVNIGSSNSWATTIQGTTANIGIGAYTPYYVNQNYGSFLPGYISNLRIVKGTALYTSSFTPPTAPLTPVTNTKLLTLQDNYLVDHSSNGHSITNNGGVTLEPESPFSNSTYPLSGPFYSGYVDGNNDTFEITNSTDFDFGTGDFTMECWFNITTFGNGNLCLWDNYNGNQGPRFNWLVSATGTGVDSTSGMTLGTYTTYGAFSIQTNEWHHAACVRDSTGIKFYLDGELKASYATSSTEAYTPTNNNPRIGDYSDNFTSGAGYISNFRVVKGKALYTSDFTVPTEPLTAIPGTVLLTLQDATVQDNSASSHSMTTNGNATITEIAPFGAALIDRAGSMYFDGNGDYLQIPYSSEFTFGTGDFTVECWVYREQPSSSLYTGLAGVWSGASNTPQAWYWYIDPSNGLRFINNHPSTGADDQIFTSPATVGLNQWYHIAVTRNGNVWRTFVNGTQAAINSNYSTGMAVGSNPLVIGYVSSPTANDIAFKGYISNFRITKGTALYTSNFTPPTAPLQPITNTKLLLSGNNGGVEDSLGKRTFKTDGNAQIDTTVKKFGSGAIEFDGNGDWLDSSGFDLSGKYTIEGWVYRRAQSGYQRIFIQCGPNWDWSSNGVHVSLFFRPINNTLAYEIAYGQNSSPYAYVIETSTAPAVNTWHYFAATCDGTNTSLFLNGTRVGTTPNILPANWLNGLQTEFSIGNNGGLSATNSNDHFNGFLDDFRVTVGVARYDPTQTTHTVPTKTHPTV